VLSKVGCGLVSQSLSILLYGTVVNVVLLLQMFLYSENRKK